MNHSQEEVKVLEYWEKTRAFQRSVEERDPGNPYVFYDGPPFATGTPHYGHLLQSITKDVVPRFWTMRGYRVERKWGWDCHGLPIEAIVEKKYGIESREDIARMSVAQFNAHCDAEIMTFAHEWEKTIRRIGRWVDMENAYMTKDRDFMESVWWVFKTLYEKGLIYEGYKVMHISPPLETVLSNFEVSQNYQDITDLSATVGFELTSGAYTGAKLLAWTTTPWTLPGNALLAVHKDTTYVIVELEGNRFICAKARMQEVFEGKSPTVSGELSGADLVGATYEPVFPYFADHKNAFRVAHGDFVTTEDGTGVVHIAPGFGADDLALGNKEGVAPIMHVQMNGHFVPVVEDGLVAEGYDVKGWAVRNTTDHQHVDVEIIKYLAHKGKLFSKKKITHSYPLCWRTDCPLINYATTSWFVKVTDVKDKMVQTNREVRWVPEHIRDGRFGKGIEGAPDWSISRARFWGTPLPIWKSEDGDVLVLGSVSELKELSGQAPEDLHKHVVDDIVIKKDGKEYRRIPDVLDCWFESGSMPYAQLHYPFENKEKFDHGFPAEFIGEAQDQTRGWFYTLHVLSNALFGMPAFKNVVVSGHIMAEDGRKMSKRLKNYPDPQYMLDTYGADAIRYYIMSSAVVKGENLNFKEADVDEVAKKFITILRNVFSFYGLYRAQDDGHVPSALHGKGTGAGGVLDAWILARLSQALKEQTESMEAYDLQRAARALQPFVTDLSTWYVRRSRDRMKTEGEDQKEALATLRFVLETFSKMLAPFMPFLAEMLYQELDGSWSGAEGRVSVHLESWPELPEANEQVLASMGEARAIVSRILEAREEAGMAIKQALGSVAVTVPAGAIDESLQQVILDEVNVKSMQVQKGELAVVVDFTLTPELIREGMVRDLTRHINQMRKEAGKTLQDRIELTIWSQSEEVSTMLEEHKETLKSDVLASEITFVEPKGEQVKSVRVREHEVTIGF